MNLGVIGKKVHLIYSEMYFIYLIYPYLVFYLGQRCSNISKSLIYIKKLIFDQVMIPNKSMITWTKSLVTVIPNIILDHIRNRTYNSE